MSGFPSPPTPPARRAVPFAARTVGRVLVALALVIAFLGTFAVARRVGSSATARMSAGSMQAGSGHLPTLPGDGRPAQGGWPGDGDGDMPPTGGYGGGRGSSSSVDTTQARRATAGQEVGLVRITTTSTYDGSAAAGTGMVLTPSGEVLTNNHVVEGATSVSATVMSTGRTYPARVLGTDVRDDVAVLELTGAGGLATVRTDTGGVQVGEKVTAVGDADGTEGYLSATAGVVTALRRPVTTESEGAVTGERLRGLIEVAADVVPGDSGGALLDANGDVVGMTTAASSGSADVTGYAIPIGKALRIVRTVDAGTATARIHLGDNGFLGVRLDSTTGGTRVAAVETGTPAGRLGLAAGDTITAVGGRPVATTSALRQAIAAHHPGDSVTLAWTDAAGGRHTGSVVLARGPVA